MSASGDSNDSSPALGEVLEGICEEDAGRSLVALSELQKLGWIPQQLCSDIIDDLRQCFLLSLSPDLAGVAGLERERLSSQAKRIGLPRVVRSIELLGHALVEMRDSPDPQVVLEVVLIRCVRTDLDSNMNSLMERVAKLEEAILGNPSIGKETASEEIEIKEKPMTPTKKPTLGSIRRGS